MRDVGLIEDRCMGGGGPSKEAQGNVHPRTGGWSFCKAALRLPVVQDIGDEGYYYPLCVYPLST